VLDQPVVDFRLKDLTRDEPAFVSLPQLQGRTVVFFFLSYQCQVSIGYEARLARILADYRGRDVTFLGIRSSAADTIEETRRYVKEKKFIMPVLLDEGNIVADYFGVPSTPLFIVMDPEGKMRYWGPLDDHVDEKRVKKQHLRDAIDAVLAGKQVVVKRVPGLG
jgi:peroxiredoxin